MALLLGLVFCLLLMPSLGRRNGWRRNTLIAVADLLAIAVLGGLARGWLAGHPGEVRWLHDTDVGRLWWLGPLVVVELGFCLGRVPMQRGTTMPGSRLR